MNKAVFLDRDGTIIIDKHYMFNTADLEFMNGAIEGLKILKNAGYLLILITNQSGIGRGIFTTGQFHHFQRYMNMQLEENGVYFDAEYYCPHIGQDNCGCRKPNLGLFAKAIQEFEINMDDSYAIGDKERDLSLYISKKERGFLIDPSITKQRNGFRIVNSVYEAAKIIVKEGEK